VKLVARMQSPHDVERAGLALGRTLDLLMDHAEANDRRERCTFVLEAVAPLLHEKSAPSDFVADFDERLPLRDRQVARRCASAVLMAVQRLEAWDAQARVVRFIDVGYDAAQARVKSYESTFGPHRFLLARRLVEQLSAMPA
jgi:hypothetical protein